MGIWVKEYIVTLKNYEDLDQFYKDMESEGVVSEFVPSRSVQCTSKRPVSRNTHYLLTSAEANILKNDPRVEAISFASISGRKIKFSEQLGKWNRGSSVAPGQKNWGLYRTQLKENDGLWGSGAGDEERTSTINITGSGKNVDIVVVDEILYPDHPEFTGRVVEYDWFRNHDLEVRGSDTTVVTVRRNTNVATIKTQTPHRLVEGTIIDLICTSDNSFTVSSVAVSGVVSDTEFRYTNTGNNLEETAATGFWRGVYQYPRYNGSNNHATAVAGVIAGSTQGWARQSNIYNLRHDYVPESPTSGEYTPPDLLIDYIRQFHATKPINPQTGRKNPTLVNNSWGFVQNISFSSNLYTGNPSYTKLFYRGAYVEPQGNPVDTGISGVCSSSALLAAFPTVEEGNAYTIITDGTSASIQPISFTEHGNLGLVDLGGPTGTTDLGIDTNDDAIWQLSLPFTINYRGIGYQNNVYVSSNSFISFGGAFNGYPELAFDYPTVSKIYLSAGDRNVEKLQAGTFGETPNRTHIIRFEGWDGAYSSLYEPETNLIWETVFYENAPNRIDVRFIKNAVFRPEFTVGEILSYGAKVDGPGIPIRIPSLDADIHDAMLEGIVFVGASGNSSAKIDTFNGIDYNNYIVENGEFIYYHRGSSPGNSHPDLICVGTLDSTSQEPKFSTSNTGPGVDLYAPGVNILTSVFDNSGNLSDLLDEGSGQLYQKWSGSSIAAAQVAGLLAIALETYPNMTQSDAKHYILNYASRDIMFDSQGSYQDNESLQTGPNVIAYYYKERADTGVLIPKSGQWLRPASGQLYPRPVIRKK